MYQMKKKLRWSALKSGVLITLSLVLLFFVVLYAGTLRQVFTATVELQAQFRDVKGLRKGAPVWLFGTEIGAVKEIRLDPIYGTIATLSIEKSAEPFLRNNSIAEILTMGLLGDKYVELSPGLPEAPPLQPGALIQGKAPMELSGVVEASSRAIQKISHLAERVDELVKKISQGEGTLSKLIHDPSLYNRTLSALSRIDRIMGNLETGQGSIGKMLTESGLYDNLNQASKDLDTILGEIESGKGMARAFLRDEELVKQVKESLADFRTVAEEMKSLLKEMEEHPEKFFKFSIF
jgi:phospholipid/cholesterol/gamma-HCH transport system substrate-binding protein